MATKTNLTLADYSSFVGPGETVDLSALVRAGNEVPFFAALEGVVHAYQNKEIEAKIKEDPAGNAGLCFTPVIVRGHMSEAEGCFTLRLIQEGEAGETEGETRVDIPVRTNLRDVPELLFALLKFPCIKRPEARPSAACTLIPLAANSAVRELTAHRVNGLNGQLRVLAIDPTGPGGASHDYVVLIPLETPFAVGTDWTKTILSVCPGEELHWWPMYDLASVVHRINNTSKSPTLQAQNGKLITSFYAVQRITFQNGPIKENGFNGNSHEALLAILLDRLEGFQSGQYACHDNQMALDHLQAARLWLHKRTLDRAARGVEGTLKK